MSFQRVLAHTAFPQATKVELVPLGEMRTPIVCQGIAYWEKLRGTRPFPAREEIRPRDITSLLQNMVLAKALEGAGDFLLKIVGDEVCRSYRAPIINRRLSDIAAELPNTVQRWLPLYRRVALTGCPIAVLVTVGLEMPEINFTHAETVCLPLGPAGGPADHIVTFGQHTARPGIEHI